MKKLLNRIFKALAITVLLLATAIGGALLTVEFRHGAFGYEYCGEFHSWAGNHNFTFNPFDTDVDFAIIGNIHDNPELLKSL